MFKYISVRWILSRALWVHSANQGAGSEILANPMAEQQHNVCIRHVSDIQNKILTSHSESDCGKILEKIQTLLCVAVQLLCKMLRVSITAAEKITERVAQTIICCRYSRENSANDAIFVERIGPWLMPTPASGSAVLLQYQCCMLLQAAVRFFWCPQTIASLQTPSDCMAAWRSVVCCSVQFSTI